MKRRIFVLAQYSHGHEATLKLMRQMGWKKSDCELVFCGTHAKVLENLSKGPGFAVVPVWNSSRGEITSVTDLMVRFRDLGYKFVNLKQLKFKVNHCLLAPKRVRMPSELTKVFSKREALDQCFRYLDNVGLPIKSRIKLDSTALAAEKVSKIGPKHMFGALASKLAAKAYNLPILAENVQDQKDNYTCFYLLENVSNVQSVKVGIVGIGGKFGRLLETFFKGLGCEVIGSDPKITGMTNADVIKSADVVIFSVPIRVTPEVIREAKPFLREGQLVIDVTSVKAPAVEAMLESKAQVLGLHPMFAPSVGFDGQTIVSCPARMDTPFWKSWVVNMLSATGAQIKQSEPHKHDTYMATVQSSPHLATLVNALLIVEMGVSVSESLSFTSPFYRVMFSLMGRLLNQSPELYTSIIMENPQIVAMLEKRIEIEKQMLNMIKWKNYDSFMGLFRQAREHFGKQVIREGDELFMRLISVTKTLSGPKSVILEFDKKDDRPGLLEKILKVFRRRNVNLTGFNFANLSERHMQFTLSFDQPKDSSLVSQALQEIRGWKQLKIRVLV